MTTSEEINEMIFPCSEKLLLMWVDQYKKDPKVVINCFLKYESVRTSVTLITFWGRKKGVLKELEGKDFTEYVNKQPLEEKWKPVLNKFLIILWGALK